MECPPKSENEGMMMMMMEAGYKMVSKAYKMTDYERTN
jgi:hypothetical protein